MGELPRREDGPAPDLEMNVVVHAGALLPVLLYATLDLRRPFSPRLRSPAGTCAALQTHPTTLSNASPERQAKENSVGSYRHSSLSSRRCPEPPAETSPHPPPAQHTAQRSTSTFNVGLCSTGGSAHQWHVDVIILAVAECAHGPEAPGEERIVFRHEQAVRVARVDVASTGEVRRHRVTLDRLDRVAVLPWRRASS